MPRRFSRAVIEAIDETRYLRVRAGARADHRFIAIWPVVVEGRVFGRSWTLKPDGWYYAFREDPLGAIMVGEREVKVRGQHVRSERLRDAVEAAFAKKYVTPASKKYVRGFKTARRREATIEFVPR